MSRAILLIGLAMTLSSCAPSAAGGSFDLAEFSISGPERLQPGPQSIEVTNSGEFPHTLVVTDGSGLVVASTSLVQSGDIATLDLDLESGAYQLTCRIVTQDDEGDIVDHFEEGMNLSVNVGA